MALIKKAVTGMRDILPGEMELRSRLMGIIRETYAKYGFTEIETPVCEHIENLCSKQGGDNEKLIFRILKRGEKLQKEAEAAAAGNFDGLCEEGLRYDLTLPLSRFYAANMAQLPQPFKALQMGPVFRADRPQKGRFRQFMQCDIDILGDATNLAEKELILATTEALDNMGFGKYDFRVVINDRRFLRAMIGYAGLPSEEADKILVILDKADKIGADGVDEELRSCGYEEEGIRRLRGLFEGLGEDEDSVEILASRIGSEEALAAGENLSDIMRSVSGVKGRSIRLCFDPTLVRGMGYYTGTIFEIRVDCFGSSVGGGGRYDKMVGNFIGQNVPAVGFSIGFERIMTLLMEDGADLTDRAEKSAWLIEKGVEPDRLSEIFSEAAAERAGGSRILMVWMAKNKKFQKENLTKEGYTLFREFYKEEWKHEGV